MFTRYAPGCGRHPRRNLFAAAIVLVLATAAALAIDAAEPRQRIPLILDTDVCDDIDDIWTLVLLLESPEFDIKLITTSVNDSAAKAKVVARILQQAGRTDIPIGIGSDKQTGTIQDWAYEPWHHQFDLSSYQGAVHANGAQAIVDTIGQCTDDICLLTIGPLPTVAAALDLDPTIAPRTQWFAMAGSIYRGYRSDEISREYNVAIFRDDADKVLSASWKDALIAPLDVAVVSLAGEDYQRVHNANRTLNNAILTNYLASLRYTLARRSPDLSPETIDEQARRQVATRSSTLFDTVPVYLMLHPDAAKIERLLLRVTKDGYTKVDRENGRPVRCALSWTDLPGFKQFLVERFTGAVDGRRGNQARPVLKSE